MKKSIEFDSNNNKIQGKFYHAEGEPPFPTVLLLSGFPGNEDDVLGLGQKMIQYGINILTFNYRGIYKSEGIFSLQNTYEDIQAASTYLHQEEVICKFKVDASKLILGGYSYGGGMALAYAAKYPGFKRIFAIAGADHGEFAREYKRNPTFAEMIDTIFEELKSPAGPVRFEGKAAEGKAAEGKAAIEELTQNPTPYDLRINATALANRDSWDDTNATIEHHLLPFYRALVNTNAQKVQITAFQDNHEFEKSREELAATIIRWIKSP